MKTELLFSRLKKKVWKKILTGSKTRKVRFGILKGIYFIHKKEYSDFWLGNYEKVISEEFLKHLDGVKVFYDLGAHVGYYTLLALKYLGEDAKIFSFEPFPSNFNDLKQMALINGESRITVFNAAISGSTGECMMSDTTNTVANTIAEDSQYLQNNPQFKVDVFSLDDLYRQGKILPPQLIKMDIEGAELDALNGAKGLITEFHPGFFMSTHNCHIPGIHKKVISFLTEAGYSIRYLDYHERKTEEDDPWYDFVAVYKGSNKSI